MPCYNLIEAWQDHAGTVHFHRPPDYQRELALPCGQCTGCRLERSRQWAIRCMHEAKMHPHNCFVTLTYKNEHLPPNGGLHYRDVQLFLKRLRKKACSRKPDGLLHRPAADLLGKGTISYYLAGEYGDRFKRPHYHLCLFGIDFHDRHYLTTTGSKSKIYRSPTLEALWPLGHSSIGELTFESAAYCARYVMKKQTGDKKNEYVKINNETGEITNIKKEFNAMSKRPAIGKRWLQKYAADAYPQGTVIVRGKETRTPRYYDKQWAALEPINAEELAWQRELDGQQHRADQTPERLAVRETVAKAKIRQLKRQL